MRCSSGVGLPITGTGLLTLDALVDLLTVHRDVARGVDTNAHLIAHHCQHGDRNVVTDHQCFTNATRKDQHGLTSFTRSLSA